MPSVSRNDVHTQRRFLSPLKCSCCPPVIDDKDATWLDELDEVLHALLVVPHVAVEVGQVGKGVAEEDAGVKASGRGHNVLLHAEPVGLLDHPVVKGRLLPPLPPRLVSSLQHFIRGIRRCDLDKVIKYADNVVKFETQLSCPTQVSKGDESEMRP